MNKFSLNLTQFMSGALAHARGKDVSAIQMDCIDVRIEGAPQ